MDSYEQMAEKLKNCPFCNTPPEVSDREASGSLRGFYFVISCPCCPCEMECWHTDLDDLFKAWDNRHSI